jgi:hypothetical protein
MNLQTRYRSFDCSTNERRFEGRTRTGKIVFIEAMKKRERKQWIVYVHDVRSIIESNPTQTKRLRYHKCRVVDESVVAYCKSRVLSCLHFNCPSNSLFVQVSELTLIDHTFVNCMQGRLLIRINQHHRFLSLTSTQCFDCRPSSIICSQVAF